MDRIVSWDSPMDSQIDPKVVVKQSDTFLVLKTSQASLSFPSGWSRQHDHVRLPQMLSRDQPYTSTGCTGP